MDKPNHQLVEVTVPHLAESLVEATVGKWLKQPGDYVEQYEVICELMTEKVNTEMPSPIEGKLTKILVQEGQTAFVGEALCLIEVTSNETIEHAPIFQPEARNQQVESKDNSNVPNPQTNSSPSSTNDQSTRYSPAVFKLAAEHHLDITLVQGTGLGGRVTRKDVEHYIENIAQGKIPLTKSNSVVTSEGAVPVPAEAKLPLNSNPGPVRSTGIHLSQNPATPLKEWQVSKEDGSETLINVTPIRSTIASRMRQSLSEIPHAWTMVEVDVTNLVVLRSKVKDEFARKEGINLTYLAFMIKAVVNAIKDYPIMNSVWAVDRIILKRDINISLAVGTEDSVYTPVIKKADQKNIAGLAKEIDELTRKARAGKLTIDDMQSGTFTVNNTGSFGSILSYPIINYPQAAIVTFESIVKKPVVIQDMIAVRSMVNLCLSLDHRILDGVICGRFLQRVKENLESYNTDTKLY